MFLARVASVPGHAAPRDWWASRYLHNKNQEIRMSLTAPSHAQSCDRIRSNPKFQQLVRRRSRLSWSLSAAVLGTYYSFMLVVAFAPQWLHAPLSQGGMLSVGIPVAASIIVVSWLLTGWYVRTANTEFDALSAQLLEELK